jgi:YggT family protein
MPLFSNFLYACAKVIDWILVVYMWIVIARVVLSWVNPDPYNPIVRFIHNITEPLLYQIRKRLPVVFGGLDLSPIIVFLAIMFLRAFLVRTLFDFSGTVIG